MDAEPKKVVDENDDGPANACFHAWALVIASLEGSFREKGPNACCLRFQLF